MLQVLAGRLNLITPDEEPEAYILTTEEERQVVDHAITSLKQQRAYVLAQASYRPMEIDAELEKINWEERIDRENLLFEANSRKHHANWQKSKREEEKLLEQKKKDDVEKRWTAKNFYNFMAWVSKNTYGKEFKTHDKNLHLIKTICFFLSKDPRFETELGYSFKKGLLVRGNAGLGKTFNFKCVQGNELCPFTIYSMIEITKTVKEDGDYEIDINKLMYLDDVGTEDSSVVNHYGTKVNWFKSFIENYYLQKEDYSKLMISTNHNFDGIENKYGFRVRSRMKDMFNTVNVTGDDMRG